MSLVDRFWEKVDRRSEEECWPWHGNKQKRGYGLIYVGGKKPYELAHRVSYSMAKGHIPAGHVVMHSCDNPNCVNPKHLSSGTHLDNKKDAVRKRRHAFGERNGGGRKLREGDVRRINGMLSLGWSMRGIAQTFKVDPEVIRGIKLGRRWRHV